MNEPKTHTITKRSWRGKSAEERAAAQRDYDALTAQHQALWKQQDELWANMNKNTLARAKARRRITTQVLCETSHTVVVEGLTRVTLDGVAVSASHPLVRAAFKAAAKK